ncbi:MAG: outer membrane beta-barrel protein [Gammaproteobacteria bacterium]|nr:outer membrane beta-barrel protein [Gammaproteobacteria bacterium]MDH3767349.1 outer membrane beta-barrel protein [Gammaproteobacteria bacterium]
MNLLRGLMLLFAFVVSTSALADAQLYSGLGIGASDADAKPSNVRNALVAKGYDVQSVSVDSEDSGWRFLVGLRFTDVWAVELGYIDLGESTTNVVGNVNPTETAQFTQDVANVLPVMPRGITLAGVARLSMSQLGAQGAMGDKLNVALKLGMIDADSEREAAGAAGQTEVDASPYYGLVLGWEFTELWRGVLGYEVFNMADSTEYWSAGLEYKFPYAGN